MYLIFPSSVSHLESWCLCVSSWISHRYPDDRLTTPSHPNWLYKSNQLTVEYWAIIRHIFKHLPAGLAKDKTSGRSHNKSLVNWIHWLNSNSAGFQNFIMLPMCLLFVIFSCCHIERQFRIFAAAYWLWFYFLIKLEDIGL